MVTAFPSKEHQPRAVVTAGVSLVLLLCYCFVTTSLLQLHDTAINPCCQVLFSSSCLKRVTMTYCLLIATALYQLDSIASSGVPLHTDSLMSLDWIVKEQFHGIRI